MVVIRPLEASRSIDIGGVPDTRVDDSVGRGLQQVGGAVSQHAQRLIEMKRQDEAFAQQQAFNRWNDDNSLEFAKAQEGMAVSGEGFAASNAKSINERAEAFMRSVPPELQPKMQALVSTAVNQWGNKGVAAQIDRRNSWFRTGASDRVEKLEGQVFNNPSSLEAAKEDAFRNIDATDLPKAEKDELKRKADDILTVAVGKRLVVGAEADPSSVRDAAARLGIPSAESGQAKRFLLSKTDKDGSHISGMKDGFAGKLANLMQSAPPEIQAGLGIYSGARSTERQAELWQAALVKYGSPEVARKWVAPPGKSNHNHGNAADLSFNGKSLKHAPQEVVSWVHNNAGRFGLKFPLANENWHIEDSGTRGGKHAEGETGKNTTTPQQQVQADPRFANLSLSQRLSLYDQIMSAAQRGQTALDVQNRAAYDAKNDALLLGIQEDKITSTQQIYEAGLKDKDTLSALKALESRLGDQRFSAEAISSYRDGNLTVDPFSSDGKKKVDAIGDWIGKAVPQGQQQTGYEELVRQSGSVPQSVLNALRVGAESQAPSSVQQALELGSRLSQINRNAISTRDGGASVQDKIDLYDSLKKNGYEASEAAKRVAELNDPELVAKRQAIVKSEPVQKVLKKVSSSDVKKIYSGWFSSAGVGGQVTDDTVKVGASFQAEAQIVSDYKGMLEDAFYEANGNETVARDLAAKRMQKVYGLSETSFFGNNTIMRLPPEKTYDPLPDGSFGYIKEQLHEALKSEGVDFDDAWLESYDLTEQDRQAGRPANYQIVFSKNGNIGLYNLPFFADRDAALEKYNALEQARVADREAAWEQSRANEVHQYPEGRDGPERFANDQLYRGVAREGSPMARAIAAQQQKTNAEIQTLPSDQERNQKIDQFLGKPRALISTQRKQLFKDAKDNGTLPER